MSERRYSMSSAAGAASLVAVALLLSAAMPLEAAKPPAGKTYYTVFLGADETFETFRECLVFTGTTVCDIDGEICGAWWTTTGKGGETGIAFELSYSDDGVPSLINGQARLDWHGRGSSMGGAARLEAEGLTSNFAFAARQVAPPACPRLLDDDGNPPPPPSDGTVVTQSRQVGGFHEIELSAAGQLFIEHTGTESLTITAEGRILPLLTSEVRGGRLILGTVPDSHFRTDKGIIYRLTVKSLDDIRVSGAGWIEAQGIDAARLDVAISGAAAVFVSGQATEQHVRISGAGFYDARGLTSRIATVNVSGTAHAMLRVSDELRGSVTGIGVIEYIGEPFVNVTTSGLGVVSQIGR